MLYDEKMYTTINLCTVRSLKEGCTHLIKYSYSFQCHMIFQKSI